MSTFRAIRIDKTDQGTSAAYVDFDEAELMDGDVDVRVSHSTINYKDGLAITGSGPIVRRFPMIPGIDLAGVVERSSAPAFKPGDQVLLTGFGVGEGHLGGLAERARVKSDWLVPLPEGLSAADAMSIGTAGFTAMLSVLALEKFGLAPADGPVVVTGAAGGVGSIAVCLLKAAGWHVVASTGRPQEGEYLKSLGAAEIIDRAELSAPGRPLGKARWAAGVDAVGSHTLANVLAQTKTHGAVAACGNAQGLDLPMTVAPFILRGVSLLGIDSVLCPMPQRLAAWSRLARDLDRAQLAAMTTHAPFARAMDVAHEIVQGKVRGRTVVDIG
ncbi:MAG: oxidoreductase [Hyphomicrobiales bacterium]|nr:oxidoreductase [Hyphomicrobiales bacterium]